jgi:hypothetical protein
MIVDSLNSTSTTNALSANQGRILFEKISSGGSGTVTTEDTNLTASLPIDL